MRAISQNFTHARYAAFFKITQAWVMNFLRSLQIATFTNVSKSGPDAEIGERRRGSGWAGEEVQDIGLIPDPETEAFDKSVVSAVILHGKPCPTV